MQTRAAAGLVVVVAAAAFTGHLLGGRPAASPTAPPPPQISAPVAPNFAIPPTRGGHILWLFVNGRWRAVPS